MPKSQFQWDQTEAVARELRLAHTSLTTSHILSRVASVAMGSKSE
jgi:hypothetical protein